MTADFRKQGLRGLVLPTPIRYASHPAQSEARAPPPPGPELYEPWPSVSEERSNDLQVLAASCAQSPPALGTHQCDLGCGVNERRALGAHH